MSTTPQVKDKAHEEIGKNIHGEAKDTAQEEGKVAKGKAKKESQEIHEHAIEASRASPAISVKDTESTVWLWHCAKENSDRGNAFAKQEQFSDNAHCYMTTLSSLQNDWK